jgi:hypothetical protein
MSGKKFSPPLIALPPLEGKVMGANAYLSLKQLPLKQLPNDVGPGQDSETC